MSHWISKSLHPVSEISVPLCPSPTLSETGSSSRSDSDEGTSSPVVRSHSAVSFHGVADDNLANKRARLEILRKFYPNEYAREIAEKLDERPRSSSGDAANEILSTLDSNECCHFCARHFRDARQAVCQNVVSGLCSKVICEVCFDKFGWDFESAISEDSGWTCLHCDELCPLDSDCTHSSPEASIDTPKGATEK